MKKPWIFVAISFFVGSISLSEEIIWVRLVSFLLHSTPQSFSFVLLCFISGIAFGSLIAAKRSSKKHNPEHVLVALLTVSGLSVVSMPWVMLAFRENLSIGLLGLLILITAAFKGAIFPLVHHYFSQRGKRLGQTLSFIYVANVMGSTLGPLLTGFILLDHFSVYTVLFVLGMCELLLALVLWKSAGLAWRLLLLGLFIALGTIGLFNSNNVMSKIIVSQYEVGTELTNVIENRHGIIHTIKLPEQVVDLVFGGNVYDGAANIDIRNRINGLDRLYLLAALQPKPKKIAVIGLSVGSWLYILRAFPNVERIDVVEINPGYVELSKSYKGYDNYINDPRVHVHFMDGRQWLRGLDPSNNKFDLIVMNTTWHWRIYASNLLSLEFLHIINKHLSEDGVATFNATGSLDAFYTATKAFANVRRYGSFIYGSKKDITINSDTGLKNICHVDFKLLGLPNCSNVSISQAIKDLLSRPMMRYSIKDSHKYLPEVITDDNMLTEYRRLNEPDDKHEQ